MSSLYSRKCRHFGLGFREDLAKGFAENLIAIDSPLLADARTGPVKQERNTAAS